ncbi:MAG: DUF2461 domain-containing protein [Dehalococcoidia bacterium]
MTTNRGTFSRNVFAFLEELQANNARDWFNANKQRYETSVREPAREFIRNMEPRIRGVSKQLIADDRKAGGSLMRIYRDVRFSKDKSPYKTNVGIQFRHRAGKDVHAPALYVHLEPDDVFVGVGIWHPDAPSLQGIRAKIDDEPDRWRSLLSRKRFAGRFTLGGESLKTAPRAYSKDHPLINDLKRKDFIAVADLSRAAVISPSFEDTVTEHLTDAADFMRFLCEAVGQPF